MTGREQWMFGLLEIDGETNSDQQHGDKQIFIYAAIFAFSSTHIPVQD